MWSAACSHVTSVSSALAIGAAGVVPSAHEHGLKTPDAVHVWAPFAPLAHAHSTVRPVAHVAELVPPEHDVVNSAPKLASKNAIDFSGVIVVPN
jgi:hypothetical protein